MRVLVCGGRHLSNVGFIEHNLEEYHRIYTFSLVITGAQREWNRSLRQWIGADWLALEWAQRREINFVGIPAKWTLYARQAGPMRNSQMLLDWRPELVIAFPGGAGTADMVRKARAAEIEVVEIAR